MKLSIIIPVYRTQETLTRCLESILHQTFTDYEIILVDDGSPDECPRLCEEYAKKYTQISVIHKENGGLSEARNTGIKQAKGEYITFIDSDDAIAENTLNPLIDEIGRDSRIDILEYPILERIGHPSREHFLTFKPQLYSNSWEYWLNEQAFKHCYACNKIFKRDLFIHIDFPKGKQFEDVQTTPLLIGLVPTTPPIGRNILIKVTDVGCYQYYWNDKGITANAQYEDLLGLYIGQSLSLIYTFKHIQHQEEQLKKYRLSINQLLMQVLNVLLDLHEISGKYENATPLIKYARLMNSKGWLSSWKLKLLLMIGFKRLCKLNTLIHKIYRHH